MLMPKRVKRRKQFRGSMKGKALRGNKITNGEYGIVAMEPCWIRSNQIEAARIAMTRYIKRGGKVWIKIFPDKPVTTKPAETRMGSGKGTLEYWVAVVKPGRVMFELSGVPEEVAREALRLAMHKLPCKCKIVSREDLEGGQRHDPESQIRNSKNLFPHKVRHLFRNRRHEFPRSRIPRNPVRNRGKSGVRNRLSATRRNLLFHND